MQEIVQCAIYMRNHFAEPIRIEALSQTCGLHPASFSRHFKKATGMMPRDYLTHIRIEHAKKMLLQAKLSREVALSTGFCDEFYFSRVFKKVVGLSPTAFIKRNKGPETCIASHLDAVRVAVTYIDEADHLVALGLQPLAVPSDRSMDRQECGIPYLQGALDQVQIIGCEDTLQTGILYSLHPDLIIAGRFLEQWGITGLSGISRTHYYVWEVDWRNTHRELAEVLQREDRAEENIASFNHLIQVSRKRMYRPCLGKTFLFLEATEQGMRVSPYTSNGGWILYQLLGLTPSPVVSVNDWGHLLTAEEAAELDADCFIVGKRTGSWANYRQFLSTPALRGKILLEVPRYPWAKGGPIAYFQGIRFMMSAFERMHK